jgi:membrane protein
MKVVDDLLDRADALQRRWRPAAFAVAAWKKFSEDRARDLAALIAFYAFVAIFPLLLVLVTVLDVVLRQHPALRQELLDSALTAYPVIGAQIKSSVHPITSTGLALAAGLIVALFGARGVARAMQHALNSAWAVPLDRRPRWPASALRGMGLIAVIGLGQILTASLSSLAVGAGHLVIGVLAEAGVIVLAFCANIGVFWLALRLATAADVSWSALRLGAILSAISWQVLQLAGTFVVGHMLRNSSELYGVFGVVLGLLTWLYVQAMITLYAIEACTVREWRLWPRSLRPPPTEQDVRAYAYYGRAERRLPAGLTGSGRQP